MKFCFSDTLVTPMEMVSPSKKSSGATVLGFDDTYDTSFKKVLGVKGWCRWFGAQYTPYSPNGLCKAFGTSLCQR
jgi:hypothetical protein